MKHLEEAFAGSWHMYGRWGEGRGRMLGWGLSASIVRLKHESLVPEGSKAEGKERGAPGGQHICKAAGGGGNLNKIQFAK